jgi:SpoVK/Ycf46/Vps4 family AAA+-type ATPase
VQEANELREESWDAIPEVNLLPQLKAVEDKVGRTCEYFFKKGVSTRTAPFRGFLLQGPPGTGKTEVVNQVVHRLGRRLGNVTPVFRLFVDGASIAAPRWGDAEKALHTVFQRAGRINDEKGKVIVHFDDIESLMLARGAELAKEWHYSINSILFHELDQSDPSYLIVCATTNRSDLVDPALRDRLFPIDMPPVPVEQLGRLIDDILEAAGTRGADKKEVTERVMAKLRKIQSPTIRDARQITVVECISEGVWAV